MFSNYIPIKTIANILIENDIDAVIDEVVNDKEFEKSETEIKTNKSKEKNKMSADLWRWGVIIIDDSNEREVNNPRIQAMFKRSRHNSLSIFINSQDYYKPPKKMIRVNGKIYHIFRPNNFGDGQNLYQNKNNCGYDT